MNILEIKNIDLGLIDPHPWNRKEFDRKKLDELKSDVAENGIETALQLRQKSDGRYEIIKGERRYTVAMELQMPQVPAQVADKDDVGAYLSLLRDNLQREDLSPIQEAAGYHRLLAMIDADGQAFTPHRIAERLHRNVHTVHRRLKLVNLPQKAREALQSGAIAERTAFLIGRLPTEQMRKEVSVLVLEGYPKWDSRYGSLLTVIDTQKLIQDNYVTNLKGCAFSIKEEDLVPVKFDNSTPPVRLQGGSCDDCPYLAKNNTDLEDEMRSGAGKGSGRKGESAGVDPLTCMNPGCRTLKDAAQSSRRVQELRKQGVQIIAEKKTVAANFDAQGNLNSREYVEAVKKPGVNELGHYDNEKAPTWSELQVEAQKSGIVVPLKVIINPETKRHVEVYDRATIIAAAKKVKGDLFKKKTASSSGGPVRDVFKEKLDRELGFVGMRELVNLMVKKGLGLEEWQMIFEAALENAGADGIKWFANWLKLDKIKGATARDYFKPALKDLRDRGTTVVEYQTLILAALLAQATHWKDVESETFKKFAKHFELDGKALRDRVTEELKSKQKKPKDQPAKKPEMKSRSKAVARNQASQDHGERTNQPERSGPSGLAAMNEMWAAGVKQGLIPAGDQLVDLAGSLAHALGFLRNPYAMGTSENGEERDAEEALEVASEMKIVFDERRLQKEATIDELTKLVGDQFGLGDGDAVAYLDDLATVHELPYPREANAIQLELLKDRLLGKPAKGSFGRGPRAKKKVKSAAA